jgi:hypothetical protein
VKTEDDTTVIEIDSFRDLRPPPAGTGPSHCTFASPTHFFIQT